MMISDFSAFECLLQAEIAMRAICLGSSLMDARRAADEAAALVGVRYLLQD